MIGRLRRIGPILGALRDPCRCQLLRVAAALDEILLQGDDLLVQQIVRLVDQAQQGVGADGGVFMLQPGGVEISAGVVAGGG